MGWFYNAKQNKLPSGRFMVGAGVSFLGFEFLSDVQPDLAAALAIAVATTAFFHYGAPLMTYINGTAKKPSATPAQRRGPTPRHVVEDTPYVG